MRTVTRAGRPRSNLPPRRPSATGATLPRSGRRVPRGPRDAGREAEAARAVVSFRRQSSGSGRDSRRSLLGTRSRSAPGASLFHYRHRRRGRSCRCRGLPSYVAPVLGGRGGHRFSSRASRGPPRPTRSGPGPPLRPRRPPPSSREYGGCATGASHPPHLRARQGHRKVRAVQSRVTEVSATAVGPRAPQSTMETQNRPLAPPARNQAPPPNRKGGT